MAASGDKDRDLCILAQRSLARCGYPVDLRVLGGPSSHGAKLDYGKKIAGNADIVVTMDSDCVVFPGWAEWIIKTLADPKIGACGSPRMEPEPGLHPSMLAMRAADYAMAPSFQPADGMDTAALVCRWIEQRGGYLQGATMIREDWWRYWSSDGVLWWHLGSGTDSAWPGYARHAARIIKGALGSRLHQKAVERVRRRARFIKAARQQLG